MKVAFPFSVVSPLVLFGVQCASICSVLIKECLNVVSTWDKGG